MAFADEFARRNNKPRAATIAGYPCLVRRASLNAWMAAGLVPQDLANQLVELHQANEAESTVDPEEAVALGRRLQQLKIELCVTGDDGTQFSFENEPGKVNVLDLADPDAFINEALELIEGLPVPTVDGEVSATALSSFRDDGNGTDQPAGAGVHGEDLFNAPIRSPRRARSGSGA